MKRLFIFFILTWGSFMATWAQLVTLKTNALMDVGQLPNLEAEITTGGKTSICVGAFGSLKVLGQDFKTLGTSPEFRYWIGGRPITHLFMGVGALAVTYDINWKTHRYKGDAVGLGLGFGYVKSLGTHWSMEVQAGTSLVAYYQHYYYEGDSYNPHTHHQNSHGFKVIPYRVGLNFSYIIK